MSSKSKVLLLSPLPPPVGGIATWTVRVLEYCDSSPSDFDVVHQNTGINYRSIVDKRVSSRVLGGGLHALKITFYFLFNMLRFRPRVIHCTSSGSLALFRDFLIVVLSNIFRIPIVLHFRFGRIPKLLCKRTTWESRLLKLVVRLASKVVVLDEASFDILDRYYPGKVLRIGNPISPLLEARALKSLSGLPVRSKRVVVFVGHVVRAKGVFELVEACSRIPALRELVLVGPYEAEIKNDLIEVAGADWQEWLSFRGSLEAQDVYKVLEGASLLALPSYSEGFPNVILEAMAFGLPVVATNVGAIPEMLTVEGGACGALVKPRDVNGLGNSILGFLENEDCSRKIGVCGAKNVLERYSMDKIFSEYEKLWSELLS